MKRFFGGFLLVIALAVFAVAAYAWQKNGTRYSDAEFEDFEGPMDELPPSLEEQYAGWVRPDGPLRVGLQVGHWKNSELPEEMKRLIGNTGAKGGGTSELAVNMEIAERTAQLLEDEGIVVDILPATVPVEYLADLFIAIHADGSPDPSVSGFKLATPRRDLTRKGPELAALFLEKYGAATGFSIDPNVTRNMRGYYAFNWRRHEHAIHPMTPALSPADQRVLIHNPGKAAQGIADAVLTFLVVESP